MIGFVEGEIGHECPRFGARGLLTHPQALSICRYSEHGNEAVSGEWPETPRGFGCCPRQRDGQSANAFEDPRTRISLRVFLGAQSVLLGRRPPILAV